MLTRRMAMVQDSNHWKTMCGAHNWCNTDEDQHMEACPVAFGHVNTGVGLHSLRHT